MTDPRDLIKRLTEKLDHLHCQYNVPNQSALVAEARAYLAQPEPEGPTDDELQMLLYYEFTTSTGHGERSDPIAFARAVLARWGGQPSTANHSANPTH